MEKVIKFEGIGTHWYIKIFDEISDKDFNTIQKNILSLVKEFQDNYSRFSDTSLVSILNRDKEIHDISDEFLELINLGLKAKELTNGHFDITVGSVLEDMGYDSKYSFQSKEIINDESKNIEIEGRTIKLGSNTRIDLGGIGKGYLIDKVKKLLQKSQIKYFFINAGGDIYATSNFGEPIEFALENPFNLNEMIGKISIKDKSIASSSNSRRSWVDKKTNKKYGHLIDMESMSTVNSVAGVYTYGDSSVNCDVSSTCLFISPKGLYPQISEYYGVEYLVVLSNKTIIKSGHYPGEIFTS
ncbi:MAG: FAD:protein FMN transferase [bacterium]